MSEVYQLATFARMLLEDGDIVVVVSELKGNYARKDLVQTHAVIEGSHQTTLLEARGTPLPLDMSAALWGVQFMQWASWVMVDRTQVDVQLPNWLKNSEPDGLKVSHHWSVDLALRYLNHFSKRCAELMGVDPLIAELNQVASRWPLSSIGMDVQECAKRRTLVLADATLRGLYIDRVLNRADAQRGEADDIADDTRRELGNFSAQAKWPKK